jgi:hypothetical protein
MFIKANTKIINDIVNKVLIIPKKINNFSMKEKFYMYFNAKPKQNWHILIQSKYGYRM